LDDLVAWAEYQEHIHHQLPQSSEKGKPGKHKNAGAWKRISPQKMLRVSLENSKTSHAAKKKLNTSL
jgi:hypothetical protein